ncbi:MAG: hypothetical protein ACTSRZ_07295 [Promethearchaeota archaeon]
MGYKELNKAFNLIEDINLSEEEIDEINKKFLRVLRDFDREVYNNLIKTIKKESISKEEIDIKEIFNLITKNLDEKTLEELIKAMTEDEDLVEYLQELLIDKII